MALIQNAVYLQDRDEFIVSRHVHDYVSFVADGQNLAIDGGCEYLRRVGHFHLAPSVMEWSLDDETDSFEVIADKLLWGTYGITGKDPLKWVPLARCSVEHLLNIVGSQGLPSDSTEERLYKALGRHRAFEAIIDGDAEEIAKGLPRVHPSIENVIWHQLNLKHKKLNESS